MISGVVASRPYIAASIGVVDPFYSFVTSLIQGTTNIVDVKGNALTLQAGPAIGTNYVPTGAIEFDGGQKIIIDGASGAFTANESDFCFEMFLTGSSSNAFYNVAFDTSGTGSASDAFIFEYSSVRGLLAAANGVLYEAGAPAFGVEHHVCLSRQGDQLKIGINGVFAETNFVSTGLTNIAGFACIGNYATLSYFDFGFVGAVRGIRMTKGHSRYVGGVGDTYAVPALPLPEN